MQRGSTDPQLHLLEDNGFIFKPLTYQKLSKDEKSNTKQPINKNNCESPVISIIPKKRPHPSVSDPALILSSPCVTTPSGFVLTFTSPDCVDPGLYHRLVSRKVPLPDRMRQLLVWCADKTMVYNKRGDTSGEVYNAAQEVMLQIIREIAHGKLNISWHSLPSPKKLKAPQELKKHPDNVACINKIKEYRRDIKVMTEECIKWDKFLESVNDKLKISEGVGYSHISACDSKTKPPQNLKNEVVISQIKDIAQDASVLKNMSTSEIYDLAHTPIIVENANINEKIGLLEGKLDDMLNTISNVSSFNAAVSKTVDRIFTKFYQNHESRTKLPYPLCPLDLLKLHISG